MARTPRCGLCAERHSDPYPRNDWGSPEHLAQSATREAVALAQANPDMFLAAWNDASAAWFAAERSLMVIEDTYRDLKPTLTLKQAAALRVVRDRAQRASCQAQRAMWRLPHPSEITGSRIGCL